MSRFDAASPAFAPVSRRAFLAGAAGLAAVALPGCSGGEGTGDDASTLTVAASPSPHAEILNDFAKPRLEEQGITLEVVEYTDYIKPNQDTVSGDVDANYFQHINYLENYNAENGTDLVSAGKVHFEPMGVFSTRHASLDEVEPGATVAVPNDPTNEGRALLLLEDKGLIVLEKGAGITATPNDIAENPYDLQFSEQEAAALPRTVDDVDFSIINGNYAIDAGLALEDVGAQEDAQSDVIQDEYANIICTTADKADDERVAKLVEVLRTDEFKQYLEETFGDAVQAAF